MFVSIRSALVALVAVETAFAHTGFTNFYVNGKNQGDAVCVRMNQDPSKWNSPVEDLTSSDMACGFSGTKGVGRVCPVPDGAQVTFEFRMNPTKPGEGVIAEQHYGPCSVYAKKVDSAVKDTAAGDGWFKIWEDGYDEKEKKWCTSKLIAANGRMTVNLPKGLAGGAYLLRPEVLALHNANQGDPQYYTGCAQVFLDSTGTSGPEKTVSIPGYVSKTDKSNSFNLYKTPMDLPYPVPGPAVATIVSGKAPASSAKQTEGLRPAGCILEMGSDYCATEVPEYTDAASCWKSGEACWKENDACYKEAPKSGWMGGDSCKAWGDKCTAINNNCKTSNPSGPPNKGKDITLVKKDITPPAPLSGGTSAAGTGGSGIIESSSGAATASSASSSNAASPAESSAPKASQKAPVLSTEKAPKPDSGYDSTPVKEEKPVQAASSLVSAPSTGSIADATSQDSAPVADDKACGPAVTVTTTRTATVTVTATSVPNSVPATSTEKNNVGNTVDATAHDSTSSFKGDSSSASSGETSDAVLEDCDDDDKDGAADADDDAELDADCDDAAATGAASSGAATPPHNQSKSTVGSGTTTSPSSELKDSADEEDDCDDASPATTAAPTPIKDSSKALNTANAAAGAVDDDTTTTVIITSTSTAVVTPVPIEPAAAAPPADNGTLHILPFNGTAGAHENKAEKGEHIKPTPTKDWYAEGYAKPTGWIRKGAHQPGRYERRAYYL